MEHIVTTETSTPSLPPETLRQTVGRALQQVGQMLAVPLESLPDGMAPALPDLEYSVLVGLVGNVSGSLLIRCSDEAAALLAAGMLGRAVDGQDELVADALGEIANLLAGNLQFGLSGQEENYCSIPNVFRGVDFHFRPFGSVQRVEARFLCNGHPLSITFDRAE